MKTVTAMEARRRFGALLNEVHLKSETIVLERAGRPLAQLSPVTGSPSGDAAKGKRRLALDRLCGCGADRPRAKNIAVWIEKERAGW